MHGEGTGRKPAVHECVAEKAAAAKEWSSLVNDKFKFIQHAMDVSGSTIEPHKLLILVDLQGMYLALQEWLVAHDVPVEDGLVIGRFARLQIERTAREVARRLVNSRPGPTGDLRHLFECIKINYEDNRAGVVEKVDVLQGGTYLDISASFDLFYAPVDLNRMAWRLEKFARSGSARARQQLKEVKSGIVSWDGRFVRDYKAYDSFVSYIKEATQFSTSEEGFFGYYVGPDGIKNFQEKEVDIRIAIRAMDALHSREADSICIVSSDQDFLPLHERARAFGVPSYQADLAKFTTKDNVGAGLKGLGERFFQGGIDPAWPLEILTMAMSRPSTGHFATYNLSEAELYALCRLHNDLNEVQVEMEIKPDGAVNMTMRRP